MDTPPERRGPLVLTGERTLPGIPDEAYWFARHVVAYRIAADHVTARAITSAPVRRVLDAGCGEGYGIAAIVDAGASQGVAVDLDESVVGHVTASYPQVGAVRAELGSLPFSDRCFDLVVSFQVIEHVWDPPGYLASLRRVLAPDGQLLVATPNRLTFTPDSETPVNPFHVREFTASELRDELRSAGLRVVSLLGIHHGALLRAAGWLYARGRSGGEAALTTRIAEQAPADWPSGLRGLVHRTRPSWFTLRPDRLDASLDLLAVCVRDDRSPDAAR
jgi:SAM-dependent methyltransferase